MRRRRRHTMEEPPAPTAPSAPGVLAVRRLAVHAGGSVASTEAPEDALRTIRRAVVGRWWLQVMPRDGGFRAEAHTLRGLPGVWAGEWRPTLRAATDDAVAALELLRHEG